jgi:hypothetical protein
MTIKHPSIDLRLRQIAVGCQEASVFITPDLPSLLPSRDVANDFNEILFAILIVLWVSESLELSGT